MTKNNSIRKAIISGLSLMLVTLGAFAQTLNEKPLTPARGYYEALSRLNPAPGKTNADWDKEKFPVNQTQAEKILRIKTYYLENASADAFKLRDQPANSSEQTKAELQY